MGRPTKLTKELLDRVVTLVRSGCYIETAAGAAGVSRSNLYEWLRKGDEGVAPYAEFYQAVTQARDQSEAREVANIAKAASKDWRASAWRLEKMHGKRYSGVAVNETRVEVVDRTEAARAVAEIYGFSSDTGEASVDPGPVPEKVRR